MKISSIKRDSTAIESGQWVGNIPEFGDVRLKVRGLSSNAYQTALAKLQRAASRDDREPGGNLKIEAIYRIMGAALHQAVLVDWQNIEDEKKAVPYDPKLALAWLTEPDYRHFLDAVNWAAGQVDAGAAEAETELVKNL